MLTSNLPSKLFEELSVYHGNLSTKAKLEQNSKVSKELEKELNLVNSLNRNLLKVINYYKVVESKLEESKQTPKKPKF